MYRVIAFMPLLFVIGCASQSNQFCLGAGHEKDSSSFEQCKARYQGSRVFYNYCTKYQGIEQEGAKLQQCLSKARNLKRDFDDHKARCHDLSGDVVPDNQEIRHYERQTIITPQWKVGQTTVEFTESVDRRSILAKRREFKNRCVQEAYGWKSRYNWKEGRNQVSEQASLRWLRNEYSPQKPKDDAKNNPVYPEFAKMHYAAAIGNLQTAMQLVEAGVVFADEKNHQGYTALHFAALNGKEHVVKYFIEVLEANPILRADNGKRPLDLAIINGRENLIQYLIAKTTQAELPAASSSIDEPVMTNSNHGSNDDDINKKLRDQIKKWF